VIARTPEFAEISFYWPAAGAAQPFDMDLRVQMRAGEKGFHIATIYQKQPGAPDAQIMSLTWKQRMNDSVFTYRYLHDQLQGPLLSVAITKQVHEDPTDQLMNETFRLPDGDIWAKHQWCKNEKLSPVHGMTGDNIGIWYIMPSYESFGAVRPHNDSNAIHETIGGPLTMLNFENDYYGRGPIPIPDGFAKYNGPFFVYLNSGPSREAIWADAKREAAAQQAQWPYSWIDNPLYPLGRGSVTGHFSITDGSPANGAWAILSDPDSDWQSHRCPYLFFTQADANGNFDLTKVRPGTYTLYAWVRGVYGELRLDGVRVAPGVTTSLGTLKWKPVSHGRLVWQIGTPDRDSHEFKGADTLQPPRKLRPNWDNFLYYHSLFPNDVNFTIGKSKESQDWYYMQPAGLIDDPRYTEVQPPAPPPEDQKPIAWKINFNLPTVPARGALFTLAFCSSRETTLRVLVNGAEAAALVFPYSGASICIRAGILDKYEVREVSIPASMLKSGANIITLVHEKPYWLAYVSYDFLRLEALD
jgi:rhamnogalacturonan endolyase